jgi:hypothetical protein
MPIADSPTGRSSRAAILRSPTLPATRSRLRSRVNFNGTRFRICGAGWNMSVRALRRARPARVLLSEHMISRVPWANTLTIRQLEVDSISG